MNAIASSGNLRPNGVKADRCFQFIVVLIVCVWLLYQITHSDHVSLRSIVDDDGGVNRLGRIEIARRLNARGVEGESRVVREKIQADLQGGKIVEIAYSDETNINDESSSIVEDHGKDGLENEDESGIDEEGDAGLGGQYENGHSFHDENGIPKEMRDVKFAGLND